MEPTEDPVVKESKTNTKNIILIIEICVFLGLLVLLILNKYFGFIG